MSIKRERDKPRLALNNITAGVREREEANRTREAGHLDEIQGVVANTLNLFRQGAVGFIDWVGSGLLEPYLSVVLGADIQRLMDNAVYDGDFLDGFTLV